MGVAMIPLLGASFIGLEHAVVLQHASTEGHGQDGHGFGNAFWWATAFTTVAAPVCLLLPGQGIPSRSTVRSWPTPTAPSRHPTKSVAGLRNAEGRYVWPLTSPTPTARQASRRRWAPLNSPSRWPIGRPRHVRRYLRAP